MEKALYNISCGTYGKTEVRSVFAFDVLAVVGLMYIGALVRIPLAFTPAPLTLQTLVVLVTPFVLGKERAFSGIALYIILGLTAHISGVTFFAAASGVTYGYLAGFLLTPLVVSRFSQTPIGIATAITTASIMILLLGALWLQVFLGITFAKAMLLGFVPFLPGDMIKAVLACAFVARLNRGIR